MDLVKAQALLSSGIPKIRIAEIFGVTPGYISQLIDAGKLFEPLQNDRDAKWNALEDTLLDKAKEIVETATNPRHVIALLQMTNRAVRRGTENSDIQRTNNTTIVSINIPEAAKRRLIIHESTNKVVGLDDQSLMTAARADLERIYNAAKVPHLKPPRSENLQSARAEDLL
jgi:hypothetical protein